MTEVMPRPVSVGAAWARVRDRLNGAGVANAAREAKELVGRAIGRRAAEVDLHAADPWPEAEGGLDGLVELRLRGTPLAYVIGEWDFRDLTLTVTPDVLIPRPETEELFDWMEASLAGEEGLPRTMVDVGTGAGGLALAMARRWPQARVFAVDRSAAALDVAKSNARRYGMDRRVEFVQGDLMGPLSSGVSVAVANLPYVASGEWDGLPEEVRREPRSALDGGPDGLSLIGRLIPQARSRLADGGGLYLEVGYDQADRVASAMGSEGFRDVAVGLDSAGVRRFVRGHR